MIKTIKMLILAITTAVMLTGCGEEGPVESAQNFYNGLKNGDIDQMKKYSTKKTSDMIFGLLGLGCKGEDLSVCLKKNGKNKKAIRVLRIIKQTETTAVVEMETTKGTEKPKLSKTNMEKVDGIWKIHETK